MRTCRILPVILLCLCLALPARAQDAPRSVALAISAADQLQPGQQIRLTAFVFSTNVATSTLTLSAPSWATLAPSAPQQIVSAPEQPGELHAVLTVAADAPAGATGDATACVDATCARVLLRVGGVVWPPPRRRIWLPLATR